MHGREEDRLPSATRDQCRRPDQGLVGDTSNRKGYHGYNEDMDAQNRWVSPDLLQEKAPGEAESDRR